MAAGVACCGTTSTLVTQKAQILMAITVATASHHSCVHLSKVEFAHMVLPFACGNDSLSIR